MASYLFSMCGSREDKGDKGNGEGVPETYRPQRLGRELLDDEAMENAGGLFHDRREGASSGTPRSNFMVGKEPTVVVKKPTLTMPTVPLMPGGKAPSTLSAPVGVSPQQAEILADELKKEGNQLYNDGQLEAAEMVYSEAIKVTFWGAISSRSSLPLPFELTRRVNTHGSHPNPPRTARCRSTRRRTTFSSATGPCVTGSSADTPTRSQTRRRRVRGASRSAGRPPRSGAASGWLPVPEPLVAVPLSSLPSLRPLLTLSPAHTTSGRRHDAHVGEGLRPPRSRCALNPATPFVPLPSVVNRAPVIDVTPSSFAYQPSRPLGRTRRRSRRTRRRGGSRRRTTTTLRGSRRARSREEMPQSDGASFALTFWADTRLFVIFSQEYIEAVQALKLRMSVRDTGGYYRVV